MKTKILSTLTFAAAFFAMPSQAAGVPLAKLTGVNVKIESVEVQDDSTLVMKTHHNGTIEKKISPATLTRVSSTVYSLQDAKIKTTHHDIVCMMVLNPFTMGHLSIAKYGMIGGDAEGYTGSRFIMNESNCASHSSTAPELEQDRQNAKELVLILRTLANEFYFEQFGNK